MTKAEKIKRIDDFCDNHSCSGDYDVEKCPYINNEYCTNYILDESSDEVINAWYDLFFGNEEPHIKDSGNRTEFDSGAVRDIQEGKGRCDLLPLDVVAKMCGEDRHNPLLVCIDKFMKESNIHFLYLALDCFGDEVKWNIPTMILEVAKHFEEGAKKYGERNWQKGIPVRCYIDSGIRHYLKWSRGDNDEPHDRAFVWNMMCAIWTCLNKPELNEYTKDGGES